LMRVSYNGYYNSFPRNGRRFDSAHPLCRDSSVVEQGFRKAKVGGSNPLPGSFNLGEIMLN
jgi:hypothetical protein